VQLALVAMLHPIIKSWSSHGWALDFIGQIHPASSKGHRFVLVAMDYFTKWTKDVLLKNMTHKEVIHFILEHIAHRLCNIHFLQEENFVHIGVHIKCISNYSIYEKLSKNKSCIGCIAWHGILYFSKILEEPRRI
jgi:hypothetical protein